MQKYFFRWFVSTWFNTGPPIWTSFLANQSDPTWPIGFQFPPGIDPSHGSTNLDWHMSEWASICPTQTCGAFIWYISGDTGSNSFLPMSENMYQMDQAPWLTETFPANVRGKTANRTQVTSLILYCTPLHLPRKSTTPR